MATPEKTEAVHGVPSLYTDLPPIRDLLTTESSNDQDATVQQCMPFLAGTADPGKLPFEFNEFGVPRLERDNHINFLYDSLGEYPAGFVGLDASRPWMLYWALTGLSILGEDVTSYRER
jgi:protein farnesyltransferase subunit beta